MDEMKPVDQLSELEIITMKRRAFDEANQAVKWMPWLSGKVPIRVGAAIRRAYHQGHLTKPINELTDKELLSVWQIGTKALLQIREALRR